MRLRLEVTTSAPEVPWRSVLRPGRSLLYDLLARGAPDLGRELHDSGLGPYRMVPFGYGAPVFAGVPRRRGAYVAGGHGVVEVGGPVPEIVAGWARGLALATLECTVEHRLPGGDHEIVVGRVHHVETSDAEAAPLLFWRDRYTSLNSLGMPAQSA